MNKLPEKLVKLRKHYNYSQRFVANVLGVDVLEYMGYENGRSILHYTQLKQLCKFYHIPFNELFVNDDDVTLYAVDDNHTDEINIEYFLPKPTFKSRLQTFFKQNRQGVLIVAGLLLVLMIFLLVNVSSHDEVILNLTVADNGRLSSSDTSVVYIDSKGVVKGRGDNSNGQLNLDIDNAVKVAEGSTFTVVLQKDGHVVSQGLIKRYADIIATWQNIVDIAVGDGHIVALDHAGKVYCTGDESAGQCDINPKEKITKIFATASGTIIVDEKGTVSACGDFIGRSTVHKYPDLSDVATSDNLTVFLSSNGKVDYYSSGRNYNEVAFYKDIVDVACGNGFIAALDASGHVMIDIDNYLIEEEVAKWENIIAIASGKDYLIAYDGTTIKGVGKNTYKQFDNPIEDTISRLAQVRNIQTFLSDDHLIIQFDPVSNAKQYLVSIDVDTGFSTIVNENRCEVPIASFVDNYTYNISVTALGNDTYEDALPGVIEFTYHQKTADDPNDEEDDSLVVEMPFALDQLVGKTKTNFEIYLKGLGIAPEQLAAHESDNECTGSEAIIESVDGISDYELVTKKALSERKISYTYCKVVNEDAQR